MQITYEKISEVTPYGKNAKKHPDTQVLKIADSIREFGFAQPIVVDKDNVIIVGHGRFMAANYLGLAEVPVMTLDISEEKAKAYRLADNKLNESDWDMSLVIAELKDLSLPMLDLTGFDRRLVLDLDDKEDDVPEVPVTPKSKYGDLYELGNHRIICGDSTKSEDFIRLMGGGKSRYGIHRPTLQRELQGNREEYQYNNTKRQNGTGTVQRVSSCLFQSHAREHQSRCSFVRVPLPYYTGYIRGCTKS